MPKRFLKNLARILRLQQTIKKFGLFRRAERENLAVILAQNSDRFAVPELKLKVYEIVLELRRQIRKRFGLLIVLGWRREWNERYASTPDVTQDIFGEHHLDISSRSLRQAVEAIKRTADFDGAILISREGLVLESGIYLENLHPKSVAQILHPGRAKDLSSAFGFAQKVHTRHLSAIAASYALTGTTVFVLSEEDNMVRITEKGRIIWSTVKEELPKVASISGAENTK